MQNITIAIATIFQNGGDATRAIEIAKIIKNYKPESCTLKIVFLTRGSQFEQKVNLKHLVNYGSAIRIPRRNWSSKTIGEKVNTIFDNYHSFKQKAEILKKAYDETNAGEIIGKRIWGEIT